MLLYVGVAIRPFSLELGLIKSTEYALESINSPYIRVIYYNYNLSTDLLSVCDKFLVDSKESNYKAFITETSDDIIESDNYFNKKLKIPVMCFSIGATSNVLTDILSQNSITYAYLNQNLIKSFYLVYQCYNVKQSVLFYDPKTEFSVYQQDMINQFIIQSDLLKISYKIISLENESFILQPNTAIIMICETNSLPIYITRKFINKIKNYSFIVLTDIAINAEDIFGSVPTFIFNLWPTDFTSTSSDIYKFVNQKDSIYSIYPMFQIIYSLSKMTLSPDFFESKFTIEEYINFNSFSDKPPPWCSASSFNKEKRGISYGMYANVFTKNILFQNLDNLYYKNFVSGSPHTFNSFSLFSITGIVPFRNCNFSITINNPTYIYQNGTMVLVKNVMDTCKLNNNFLSENGNSILNQYIYEYNKDGYFTLLKFVPLKRIVDEKMSILKKEYYLA